MVRILLLAAALLAFSPLASQAQSGRWPSDRAYAQHGGAQQGNPGRQRDASRGENDRRNAMSPEERRELNRDLQRANREIYRKGKERPQRR